MSAIYDFTRFAIPGTLKMAGKRITYAEFSLQSPWDADGGANCKGMSYGQFARPAVGYREATFGLVLCLRHVRISSSRTDLDGAPAVTRRLGGRDLHEVRITNEKSNLHYENYHAREAP